MSAPCPYSLGGKIPPALMQGRLPCLGVTLHSVACGAVKVWNLTPVAFARNALFVYALWRSGKYVFWNVRVYGLKKSFVMWYRSAAQASITFLRSSIPAANNAVVKQVDETVHALEKSLLKKTDGVKAHTRLPKKGLGFATVVKELEQIKALLVPSANWEKGYVSGAVYNGAAELQDLVEKAFRLFSVSNPLHPEVFPAVRQMESEIVSMVAGMFNGDENCVGNVTSGGTESILLACLAYREYAHYNRGIDRSVAEIVVPSTVHAAFDKAAGYCQMKIVHVPVDENTGKVLLSKVESALSPNTILLVGSAPNFPHGIVDDIPALSALAIRHNIPLHVDCCLGGFIVPFAEEAGLSLPYQVDFRVAGVTSISADTHKYGFAPKGSSVILYRSNRVRQYQYYVTTEWSGGVYATPTAAGSRPGALIAGCWAAMLYFGRSGYVEATKRIVSTSRQLALELSKLPGIQVMGEPLLSVVAFKSAGKLNIFAVAELLQKRHWHLNVLQNPAAIHIAVTLATCNSGATLQLVKDVKECLAEIESNPQAGNGAQAAIYGTVATIPDRSIVSDVAKGFLDALTKTAS